MKSVGVEKLENLIISNIPENPHFFLESQATDKDLTFRLCEIVREKLTRMLGDELPYALTVQMEKVEVTKTKRDEKLYVIYCVIWVDKSSQKKIIIGKKGEKLKQIGILSRSDMQKMLDSKVHLQLWVKVKKGWMDDKRSLKEFGYIDVE